MIHIEQIIVGAFEVNCWVVWGANPGAIVIDPGGDANAIRNLLATHRLEVAAYMLTHGHIDHIAALADMHETHPAPIGLHPADAEWAFAETNLLAPFYASPPKPCTIERTLADGQKWNDSDLEYSVISTPGHTPGSVCFHFEQEGTLICGDTLFQGSVGRSDLPGGDSRTLTQSLRKLAILPDHTVVYSGHGPTTTMANEKQHNYFIQAACRGA